MSAVGSDEPCVVQAKATLTTEGADDWILYIRQPGGQIVQKSQIDICEDYAPSWLQRFWDNDADVGLGIYKPGDIVMVRGQRDTSTIEADQLASPSEEEDWDSVIVSPVTRWRGPSAQSPTQAAERDRSESKRKRSPTPEGAGEEIFPVLHKRKRNTREVQAERHRLQEYQGHHVLLAADAVPEIPTDENGLPIQPKQPRPISVKERLTLPSDQLNSISPGDTPRQSSRGSSSRAVQNHRSAVLTHNRESGGLVSIEYSKEGTTSIRGLSHWDKANPDNIRPHEASPTPQAPITSPSLSPAPNMAELVEEGIVMDHEPVAVQPDVSPVAAVDQIAADDEDELPDFEDVCDEEDLKPPPPPPPPIRSLPTMARTQVWNAKVSSTRMGSTSSGIRPGVALALSRNSLKRFKPTIQLPPRLIRHAAEDDNWVAPIPIHFVDPSNVRDPEQHLFHTLAGRTGLSFRDTQIRSREDLAKADKSLWRSGAGMSARVEVLDGKESKRSRKLVRRIVRHLLETGQYVNGDSVLLETRLIFFPAEDEELCDILSIDSPARGQADELLVCRLTLPLGTPS